MEGEGPLTFLQGSKRDVIVKSWNQTAKKKDSDARRANHEEWGVHRSTLQWRMMKRNAADGLFTKPSKEAVEMIGV